MRPAPTPVRPPVPPEVAALPRLTVWDAATLRAQLESADPKARLRAFAMCLQPEAPIDAVLVPLARAALRACGEVRAAEASRPEDAVALQLAAAALGQIAPAQAGADVDASLCALLAMDDVTTRTHAAHALWRLGRLPNAAAPLLARLLVETETAARKAAALAASRNAPLLAKDLVETVHATPAVRWTVELLDTLARSAGKDRARKRAVETFLIDQASAVPRLPAGVAILTALARLGLSGQALSSLCALAAESDAAVALAAIAAIGQLGEDARAARRPLLDLLARLDDPEREEAICRVVVGLKPEASELPLARLAQRIGEGTDRAAAAHCLLATTNAGPLRDLARVVKLRYERASDALRPVLAATYERLAGEPLTPPAAAL
ncbi:MAG: hypothetical protein ACK4XK_01060 [Casimicrobiaceae bacterium]